MSILTVVFSIVLEILGRVKDKKKTAFLSDQCKEIEEKNRAGKTRDLFKKMRDTKGHFMQRWVR